MSAPFTILNPCAKRWAELPGDGRKRFCPECQTNVYALEQHTAEEIIALKKAQGEGYPSLSVAQIERLIEFAHAQRGQPNP